MKNQLIQLQTHLFLAMNLEEIQKNIKKWLSSLNSAKKVCDAITKNLTVVCPNSPEKLYSPVNKWRDLFLLMFSREISIFRDQSFWLLTKVSNLWVVAIWDNCMAFPAVQRFLLSEMCYVSKFEDFFVARMTITFAFS